MEVRVLNFREFGETPTDGCFVVNCTSRGKDLFRSLSPFYLGPVSCYGGLVAQNVENAWQYSKVYPQFADGSRGPKPSYFAWRDTGWGKTWADRYPAGKGAVPLYSYWETEDGPQKLDYIAARKTIYIPLYTRAAYGTEAFAEPKKHFEAGEQIIILDFDAYDHIRIGYSAEDIIHDPRRKMGHGFVLKFMLENSIDNALSGGGCNDRI